MTNSERLKYEIEILNLYKNEPTEVLIALEKHIGDILFSKSCEEIRLEYNVIVNILNQRGVQIQ